MNKDIYNILNVARNAPSGDNSQPWEFKVSDNKVRLYNLPAKDNPVLNFEQRGSYVAHGALIENVLIAADHFGYRSDVTLFPDSRDQTCTAEFTFERTSHGNTDQLYNTIPKRVTNRKPYYARPLLQNERDTLLKSLEEVCGTSQNKYRIILEEDVGKREHIGSIVASIEQVILEDYQLHQLLFRDIVWSEKQEREQRHGLFVQTMEFAPPQKIAFRLASYWPLMRIFIALGLPKKIVADDAYLYASGSATVVITTSSERPDDFIMVGRMMQRLWLYATSLGISIQPVTALLFAAARIASGDRSFVSNCHIKIIEDGYNELKDILNVKSDTLVMLLRIGFSDPPSTYSSKKDLVFKRT